MKVSAAPTLGANDSSVMLINVFFFFFFFWQWVSKTQAPSGVPVGTALSPVGRYPSFMLVTVSCSVVTPWSVAGQAPLSMKFSRQEYWSGLPFPSLSHLNGAVNMHREEVIGVEPPGSTEQRRRLPCLFNGLSNRRKQRLKSFMSSAFTESLLSKVRTSAMETGVEKPQRSQ